MRHCGTIPLDRSSQFCSTLKLSISRAARSWDETIGPVVSDFEDLHRAVLSAFDSLCPLVEYARIEKRDGYWVLSSPLTPFPPFCGVWANSSDHDSEIADALEDALHDIETEGMPFWLQVREGQTPITEARARRLGLSEEEISEAMVLAPADLKRPCVASVTVHPLKDASEIREALKIVTTGFEVPENVFEAVFHHG